MIESEFYWIYMIFRNNLLDSKRERERDIRVDVVTNINNDIWVWRDQSTTSCLSLGVSRRIPPKKKYQLPIPRTWKNVHFIELRGFEFPLWSRSRSVSKIQLIEWDPRAKQRPSTGNLIFESSWKIIYIQYWTESFHFCKKKCKHLLMISWCRNSYLIDIHFS